MHVNCPYICTHIYTQCCFSVCASCLHIFAQSDKNQRKITAENLRQHLPSSVGESEKTLFLRLVSSDALMHCFIYHIYTYTSDILISANHVKNMSLFATKKMIEHEKINVSILLVTDLWSVCLVISGGCSHARGHNTAQIHPVSMFPFLLAYQHRYALTQTDA